MNWQFSNSAPIYTQLIGQIRAGIVSGALAPGERLPSVRALRHGGSGRDFRCAARAGGGKGADIFIGYDRAGL